MTIEKIGIIISVYNCPKWIFNCLDGWKAQHEVSGWEVEMLIGVDGCDATHQALIHHNVPHFWSQRNVGWPIITNSLHALSNADVYIRFDADDVPLPTYLTVAVSNLARSKCFQFLEYRTDRNLKPIKKHDKSNTMVYTREVVEKIGGYQPFRVGADKDFIRRARSAGFSGSNPTGYHFYKRQHETALTRAKETNMKSAFRRECEQQMRNHTGHYVDPVVVELQRFEC